MTNITKAAQDALAELADWHWSQAATLRKAAGTSAMDKPEPCQSSLTRMADWHEEQKQLLAALQGKAEEVREPVAYRVDYPGVDSIGLRRFFGADQWAASKGTVEFLGGVAVPLYAQPAPVVPDDVARDAGWFRRIRDGSGWPAVFASHDAPEPLCGDDLDAAMLAASQQKGWQ